MRQKRATILTTREEPRDHASAALRRDVRLVEAGLPSTHATRVAREWLLRSHLASPRPLRVFLVKNG